VRHSPFTAVYDACVLYPAPLRDLLVRLGLSGRFRARWSAQIHDEWQRNLLRNRPDLTAMQIERTSGLMDRAIPDALVCGHEHLVAGLDLPDQDDRHVLAAQRQRAQLKAPPIDVDQYLEVLLRQGLVQTTKLLAPYRAIL